MPDGAYSICVYYYSLPEFPSICNIVEDSSLFIRDVLVSNPNNPHIEYGGQYDPHYEYPLTPEYKVCSKKARRKVMSVINEDAYDSIYLVFRTNRLSLTNMNKQYVSGYYDVDVDRTYIDPNYNEPVIYAKEARFVELEDSIDISDFLAQCGNYRFPFSSETNDFYKKHLNFWKDKIASEHNLLDKYIDMTEKLDKLFKYYEFEEGTYPVCVTCKAVEKCRLTKRIQSKGKLYHQLPKDIANTIGEYYKKRFRL